MNELLKYPFDGALLQRKKAKLKKELINSGNKFLHKRIAILGGSTTDEVKDMLELWLLSHGIMPQFYQSEYNQYWNDAVFSSAELDAFSPEIVYIHTTYKNIKNKPSVTDDMAAVDILIESEFAYYTKMWQAIHARFNCVIIQNNFEQPLFRLFGNRDTVAHNGLTNFIARLNLKFYEYAQSNGNFFINDINFLSADYGLRQWHDVGSWSMYKYAMNIKAIPNLAYSIANIIKAIYGKNKKALVLDLDNTLWGGIVGDDGVEGLQIGTETAVAEAYTEFQSYIKAHGELGIILNIASKNEHENAIAGLSHQSGVLKEEDFVVIKANWNPKDSNIISIAEELNILPESMVFLDDNPAEREIASKQIAGLAVPPMDDVVNYITTVDRAGYFESVGLSKDDLERNSMYKSNIERAKLQTHFADYGEYLTSLDMTADICSFMPVFVQRISQLTNKSNQYNVTTKRYSEADIKSIMTDDKYIGISGSLKDKFGDNGIVSVAIAKKCDGFLDIELFLMSCRVLKRGMENAMMDELVRRAKADKIAKIRGYYYKSAKNNMVKELYKDFGFDLVQTNGDDTIWELDVETYLNGNKYIEVHNG